MTAMARVVATKRVVLIISRPTVYSLFSSIILSSVNISTLYTLHNSVGLQDFNRTVTSLSKKTFILVFAVQCTMYIYEEKNASKRYCYVLQTCYSTVKQQRIFADTVG